MRISLDPVRDLAIAWRSLRRQPGFLAVAIATLALGIGAPTAIFSVVHAVLLRPLQYPEADRLVRFTIEGRGPAGAVAFDALPADGALAWNRQSDTLAAMALYNERALTLTTGEGPFRLQGIAATPNLFGILGVAPLHGTNQARGPREIVLSYESWQRFFASSPAVVGTSVVLDGEPYLVSGVMPPGFDFPSSEAAFWVPLAIEAGGGRGMLLPAIARLRPGATLPAVVEEGQRVLGSVGGLRESTLIVRTMKDLLVGRVERLLWVLLFAVGLVFAVASTNIALLLMTRGAARERELSIRVAIGASRRRLVGHLLLEAAVLAGVGGLAGLLVSWLGLQALLQLAPPDMPRLLQAGIDAQVLGFAGGLTLASCLFFGLLSAGHVVALDPVKALGRLGGDISNLRAIRRRLNLLAAAELALALVLLVGAGLLLRTFVRTLLVDHGFREPDALAFQIHLPGARYPSAEARFAFHERLLDRLDALEGVVSGIATSMPNRQPTARFIFDARPVPEAFDPQTTPSTEVRTVSEGFLEAAGVPLRAGRHFRPSDRAGAEPVVIVSEALARRLFPEGNAVGQTLYSIHESWRVVGVVGDIRPGAPTGAVQPAAYLPLRQDVRVLEWFGTATVVVRGGDPQRLAAAARPLVLSLDPELPSYNVRTLGEELSRLVAAPRFSATVLAVFGVAALALATIGVYGVMSHSVRQRTRELGVRIALGATKTRVLWLVLRDGTLVVAGGLLAGLLASAWLSRSLTGLLHEVTPGDPSTMVLVAMLLAGSGLLASYLPARRATCVDPIEVLREE